MKIKDVMTSQVITIDKDEDLSYILSLMKKHNITKIPVIDDKKFVGIVTDNMIAYKLGSIRKREITAARLHASSVVEKNIQTVSPNDNVSTVIRMVGEPGPTMLPVLDNNKSLVGVLTKADILPFVSSKNPISTILHSKLFTVSPDDRVIHARRLMVDEQIARLPVLDKGSLIGIISDSEIAFAFATLKNAFSLGKQKHRLDELLVKKVMKSPVIWTTSTVTIEDAARLMLKHNIGALPILENDKLIGIITRTDLLKTIAL